jgi:endo-1,4-beta-mannosidase
VPFYAQLIQSFTGKPLLFSELGNPACAPGAQTIGSFECLDEDEMAAYAYTVLVRLHAIGTIGAMWWNWSDYVSALYNVPPCDKAPHELHFGMIRADGTERPVARLLAQFAAQQLEVLEPPPPIADEASFYASLPGGIDALYRRYRG